MKILILTTIYKRPSLTSIVLDYYRRLKERGLDIELLCCGSEGAHSALIAELSGWNYVEYKNEPLAQKHNTLFTEARKYEHDAVMLIGSDDLISEQVIKHYQKHYTAQTDYMVGFNMLHFYSTELNELIYFKGYRDDHTFRLTMGAGRLFPRAVLEKMNYNLWNESRLNRGLDSVVSTYLKNKGIKEIEIKLQDIHGGMILDIKTDFNVTEYKRLVENCNKCDVELAYAAFPLQMQLINKIYGKTENNVGGNSANSDIPIRDIILDPLTNINFLEL